MEDTPRILVVEDDASWQDIYAESLGEVGYAVETAGDLKTALEALERKFFHVAVVDLKLSDDETNRDGLEVLRRIWELNETLAIVGSGYADVSMFDEFQRMGIFGFTQIPAEARKAFEKIDFYKGQIRKDESLQNILDKVNKAVAEAWPKSIRRRWSISPFGILKKVSAREVQRSLRAGPMTELRPFLLSLVQPLFPWLQAKDKEISIREGQETLAFETLCWSRALGKAVVVRFGRREDFQKSVSLEPLGSAYNIAEAVEKEDIAHVASDHFEGVVRGVPAIEFSQHFDPLQVRK